MDGVQELAERAEALAELAGVDAGALSGDRALGWLRALVQHRNLIDALIAPLAGRLDELSEGPSRYARWKGSASAPALIEAATGLARADAVRLIALGRALTREVTVVASPEPLDFESVEDAPVARPVVARPVVAPPVVELSPLARAARAGVLGEPKIRVIAKTLEDITVEVPELEALLVERAHTLSLKELRVFCLQRFAALDPDGYAARQSAQSREAELKFYPRPDGMVGVTGALDPVRAGHIIAWFDAEGSAAMHAQRELPEHERRSIGNINADTLASLARHADGCTRATTRPKTTVVVRVDEQALREGVGLATCDSLEAPISMETLRRMAIDAEMLPVVMGGASLPLDVGRAMRSFTDAQRIALGERDKGCANCHASLAWCDAHHIEFWSRGGRSDLSNGVMLCVGCHHRVHDCGWIIDVVDGQGTFTPPATVDPHRRRRSSSPARLAA